MRLAKSLLQNLLLSVAVTALLVGALEGVCRLVETPREAPEVAEYIWDWDKRWEGDFYTVSADAVGWPPWEEFNADGLRDRTHAVEKPRGTWRLVVLGDSVTMGAGIAPQEAYPQVLQAQLDAAWRRVEVFNVALWGWSTRQERIAYQRLARHYRPDLVLLGVCLNDIPELQDNLARPPRWLQTLHERSALVRRIVSAEGREIQSVEQLFTNRGSRAVREGYARFFAEVRALRDEVRSDGAAFAVVVFPFRFQLARDAPPPSAQEEIRAFCAAEGIRAIDVLPRVREAGEAAFIDYDHLSPLGSRLAAEEILRSGLLPATPSEADVLLARLERLGSGGASATAWVRSPSGTLPPEGLSALVSTLADADPGIRTAAAWALQRAGAPAQAAVPALVEAFREGGDDVVRAGAAMALGAIGSAARPAVPLLLEGLGDPVEGVRWAAAQALWRIGMSPEAAPRLATALKSRDPYVRGFAAWSLGEMGPAAREAVPALVAALEEDEAYGRGGAAAALAKMGPAAREAVPALLRGLGSAEEGRRWRAARAIGRIGPEARGAVPALARALADADARVRFHAARALGRIGPEAKGAVAALNKAARDPDRSVRKEAERALRRIAGVADGFIGLDYRDGFVYSSRFVCGP